jgi:hypothetical protein
MDRAKKRLRREARRLRTIELGVDFDRLEKHLSAADEKEERLIEFRLVRENMLRSLLFPTKSKSSLSQSTALTHASKTQSKNKSQVYPNQTNLNHSGHFGPFSQFGIFGAPVFPNNHHHTMTPVTTTAADEHIGMIDNSSHLTVQMKAGLQMIMWVLSETNVDSQRDREVEQVQIHPT